MNKTFHFLCMILILTSFIAPGCKKDKLDKNGLTKDINAIAPDYIIDIMKELGMPIYGGDNPPSLTGGKSKASYFVSPHILLESNRWDDEIGKKFADMTLSFEKQDRKKLTVLLTTKETISSGTALGEGIGAYVVGSGNQFSVFAQVIGYDTRTSAVNKTVEVYSGKIVDGGIENLYTALIMVDDGGDPNDIWIENDDCRVFHDSDGFSELINYYYEEGGKGNTQERNLPTSISSR